MLNQELVKNKKIMRITREKLDSSNKEKLIYKAAPGISKELIIEISKQKNEPEWMLKKRLEALSTFNNLPYPNFGPDLKELDISKIHLFVRPDAPKNAESWKEVPEDIRNTFDKLGIPEAEKKVLSGVGAQYDSDVIYHKLKEEWEKKGIIFLDCDEALKKHQDLFKKYFMTTCISPNLHKFTALHAAVWSGGTFIYVPKNVKVNLPLQAYFRMNSQSSGQFEHTLIIADEGSEVHYVEGCSAPRYSSSSLHAGCVEIHVLKNAKVRYSSIENWSKNTYNLNTKRAVVYENGIIEWVNGNMGSKVTMLYPCSVLIGKNARSDYIGIAYAGKDQYQDTGCKVYHLAPNTTSIILSKGISKQGGVSSYRGLVKINKGALNSKTNVRCEGLMLDDESKAMTFPSMEISESKVEATHEATVGKIGEDQLFYLMSRGLTEEEATKMIVSGFIEPVIKQLPLEYAVELNKLIELEIENSIC